jgi:hypothetical protein
MVLAKNYEPVALKIYPRLTFAVRRGSNWHVVENEQNVSGGPNQATPCPPHSLPYMP